MHNGVFLSSSTLAYAKNIIHIVLLFVTNLRFEWKESVELHEGINACILALKNGGLEHITAEPDLKVTSVKRPFCPSKPTKSIERSVLNINKWHHCIGGEKVIVLQLLKTSKLFVCIHFI